MSEQRHAALAIHPIAVDDDGEHHELLRRRQIVRRTRIAVIVVLVLLAARRRAHRVRAACANARALEAGTAERATQYVKTALPQTAGRRPDAGAAGHAAGLRAVADLRARERLPASAGPRTSAAASRRASCWPRSRRPKSTSSSRRRSPRGSRPPRAWSSRRAPSRAGRTCARRTWSRSRTWTSAAARVAQATANLAAADANVQRLRQTEGFKRVLAPFAGVITRRNVDVGDLIDAGGGGGRALFLLAQTDPLRVYINVPQAYAQLVKAGQPVVVTQAELRGQSFKGEVARTSGAIDAATRMMQVEVALPNRDGTLLPGAYVQVSLPLAASQSLTIPANALLFRAEGTRVAVVDARGPGAAARRHARAQLRRDGRGARWHRRHRPPGAQPVGLAGRGRRRSSRRQGTGVSRAVARDRRRCGRRCAAGRLRRRARLPHARRSTCRSAGQLEEPWRQGTPNDARRQGPVVAALRRSAARRAAAAGAGQQPDAGARQRAAGAGARHARAAARPARYPQLGLGARASRLQDLRQPAAHQLRAPQLLDGAERLRAVAHGELRARPRRPRAALGRRRDRLGRAIGRRPREHAAAAHRRPGVELLQPALDRHRARRAGALDRAAAPRAGAGDRAPRPGRRLGPGRGAAAGAARHHADAGRRAEASSARSTSTRSPR